jgi:TRAP-type C4-dicarboxylate transport system permease small subunit
MKGIRHITLGLMLAFCLVFIAGCIQRVSLNAAGASETQKAPTELAAGKTDCCESIVPAEALVRRLWDRR